MDKYKNLNSKLKEVFSDSDFYVDAKNYGIEILYNNENYVNNDEFLDKIISVATEFLTEEELWSIVTTFDLNNIILEKKALALSEKLSKEKFHVSHISKVKTSDTQIVFNNKIRIPKKETKIECEYSPVYIPRGIFKGLFNKIVEVTRIEKKSNYLLGNMTYIKKYDIETALV